MVSIETLFGLAKRMAERLRDLGADALDDVALDLCVEWDMLDAERDMDEWKRLHPEPAPAEQGEELARSVAMELQAESERISADAPTFKSRTEMMAYYETKKGEEIEAHTVIIARALAARPQPKEPQAEASGETFCPDCGGDGYTIEQVGTYPDGSSEPGQRMCERCEGKGSVPISHLVYRAMDKDIIFEVLKEYGAMIQTIERQYGKPYDRTKLNNALAIVYTEDRLASARASSGEKPDMEELYWLLDKWASEVHARFSAHQLCELQKRLSIYLASRPAPADEKALMELVQWARGVDHDSISCRMPSWNEVEYRLARLPLHEALKEQA